MNELILWPLAGLVVGVLVASFFEWALHRYVMHRPVGRFDYPFRTHALVHHRVFRADESYHVQREEDKALIPMAWWNGPAIIAVGLVPFVGVAWAVGHWWLLAGVFVAFAGYFATYEYLHWCMHLPRRRRLERSWLFQRLNSHHLLHHRYMHKNFNVVLPLADLILGTLLLKPRTRFAGGCAAG